MAKTLWLLLSRHGRLLFLSLALTSCKMVAPSFQVLQANYYFEQGHYQDSVALYFKALEHQIQESEIYYNLGVAYSALGEIESAIEMWDRTFEMGSGTLNSYTLYNQGVAYYQLSRYDEAIEQFRSSLMLNPSSINTKINLELALKKQQEYQKNSEANSPKSTSSLNEQQTRTLDYLKRNEVFLWGRDAKEGEWSEHQDDW